MNLIPTIISVGLASSIGIFYLKNQSDEPNKINYRAALSEFEQSAIDFSTYPQLDPPKSNCPKMVDNFVNRLPEETQWKVEIKGLDCDMAVLSLTMEKDSDFINLLSAATASGRAQDANIDFNLKTIEWYHRLYTRDIFDLGLLSQRKKKEGTKSICDKCSNQ